MSLTKVILKSGKDQSLRRLHPWVLLGAIKKIKGPVYEGCLVEVYDNKDEFLGVGHYQDGGIAVRILSFEQIEINADFFKTSIQKAAQLRNEMDLRDNKETNVFRLVHAEGDFLPGLIIDFYNGTAVVQMHSVGMFLARDTIYEALKLVLGDQLKAIYEKSEATLPLKADIQPKNGLVWGETKSGVVQEYGNKFLIDWVNGQKTGFFIDQRENRKLVGHYSKGKDVLNVFGFTGGFSIYALSGGAKSVHSVDSSKSAIEMTDENVELNFQDDRHESFAVDAFTYLDDIDQKYDLIILDPPAFAKHQNVLNNALQGYKKLNAKAIRQIRPGGILFTFSCSQVVSKENFRKSIFTASANVGRKVQILHQLSQPVDHPINIYHPESEYLKGFVVRVD